MEKALEYVCVVWSTLCWWNGELSTLHTRYKPTFFLPAAYLQISGIVTMTVYVKTLGTLEFYYAT